MTLSLDSIYKFTNSKPLVILVSHETGGFVNILALEIRTGVTKIKI